MIIPNGYTPMATKAVVQAQLSAAGMGLSTVGTGHLLMGIVLLLGSVFYTVYFYHADQKLFTLRREAAEAELAYTRKAGDDHER